MKMELMVYSTSIGSFPDIWLFIFVFIRCAMRESFAIAAAPARSRISIFNCRGVFNVHCQLHGFPNCIHPSIRLDTIFLTVPATYPLPRGTSRLTVAIIAGININKNTVHTMDRLHLIYKHTTFRFSYRNRCHYYLNINYCSALECYRLQDANDYKGRMNHTISGKPCDPWSGSSQTVSTKHQNYCRTFDQLKPWCWVDGYSRWELCAVVRCETICSQQEDGFDYVGGLKFTKNGNLCRPWESQDINGQIFEELSFPMQSRSHSECRNPGRSQDRPWCYVDGSADDYEECSVPMCPEKFYRLEFPNCSDVQPITLQYMYYWDLDTNTMIEYYNYTISLVDVQFYCQYHSVSDVYGFTLSDFPYWVQISYICVVDELIPNIDMSYCQSSSSTLQSSSSTLPSSSYLTPANSVTLTNNECSCRCFTHSVSNKTKEIMEDRLENIKKVLSVPTSTLSATIRKRTSATDPRPSATYVGFAAIFIFSMTFVMIIIPDIINVIYFFKEKIKQNK